MLLLNKHQKLVRAFFEEGGRVNLETGEVLLRSGKWTVGYKHAQLGYKQVSLFIRGGRAKGEPVFVHRLIAYAKFGDDLFKPGLEVRHLDGDKENNTKDNIALGTRADNIWDMPAIARKRVLGRASPHRLLGEDEVSHIRSAYAGGFVAHGVCKALAEQYAVSTTTVSAIGRGRTYNGIVS